jgi:hypothetical protein
LGRQKSLTGAVGQTIEIRHTEKGETDISLGESSVPCGLAEPSVAEKSERRSGGGILGEVDIGWELEDLAWGVVVNSLSVEFDIPYTWGGILWGTGESGVHNVLLGGGVGTDESGKIDRADSLVLEELDKGARVRVDVRKETGWGLGAVWATDKGQDTGSERAGDGGDGGHELDQVSSTHAVLLVSAEDILSGFNDLLETIVFWSIGLG